jgi:hypothetical protein
MRLPRFNVRSLLVLILIAGIVIGLVVQQARIAQLHREPVALRNTETAARLAAAQQEVTAQFERDAAFLCELEATRDTKGANTTTDRK